MARIIMVWGLWGPYHCRRFEAFRDHAAREGHQAIGVSLFSGSRDNQWGSRSLPDGVVHLDLGKDETRLPLGKIGSLLAIPRKLRAEIALLPSYFHWSLALNAGMRLAGGRVVMMNETHAGTARARGLKAAFKQRVVAGFHAGFVGGGPQKRYFASLGLPAEKIFAGYDAVDNDYFAAKAAEVRLQTSGFRSRYGLPEHYFLSLGRFVAKKNLTTLIRAYRKVLDSRQSCQMHLVMVGSGEEEPQLRALCQELRLPIYDKAGAGIENRKSKMSCRGFISMASARSRRIRCFMRWRRRSCCQACGKNGGWWSMKPWLADCQWWSAKLRAARRICWSHADRRGIMPRQRAKISKQLD